MLLGIAQERWDKSALSPKREINAFLRIKNLWDDPALEPAALV